MGILAFFGEAALRASLLGMMGGIAAWALRRRGPEVQHAIWRIVLAGMLALPLLMTVLPPLAILPSSNVMTRAANAFSTIRFSPSIGISSGFISGLRNVTLESSVSLQRRNPFQWPMFALIVYAAVAALLLIRIASAWRRAKKATSAAARVSIGLLNELEYPRPEMRESAEVAVPFTLGCRNPIIVLPNTWRQWDDFKLRSVLVHELAHVHRGDWATALAAGTNRAVFWFHPLAWWLENRLASLAEEACDARALRLAGDPSSYARVVLEFAQAVAGTQVAVPTSMARTSKVGRRINSILEGRVSWSRAMHGFSWALILAVGVPAVYGAGAFQLISVLTTPPSPYASMSHIDGVRAILADGWTLTPDEAAKLESEVGRDPENVAARIRLLSHYTQYMVLSELRSKHLLWLIEHHPDSDVFQLSTPVTAMAPDYSGVNSPDIERARILWLEQAERYATNTKVLANAATVFGASDGRIAFELLKRLRALEPQNPEWLDWLAEVYATAVRSSFANGNPRVRTVSSARKQTVHFPVNLPLIESRLLKSELESSSDAALVGSTADALLSEIAVLKTRFAADPEIQASEAFAKELHLRAQQLRSR